MSDEAKTRTAKIPVPIPKELCDEWEKYLGTLEVPRGVLAPVLNVVMIDTQGRVWLFAAGPVEDVEAEPPPPKVIQ